MFASNHIDLKQINRLAVINLVKMHPGISRASLAKETGLNKSTIGKLVQELLDEHWLQEDHTPTPLDGAGRRPTGLTLNGNVLALLGAEIGVDYITVIASSITGETLFNSTLPYIHEKQSSSLDQLVELLEHAWGIMDAMNHQVLGLGVAVPGLVNTQDEKVVDLPNLGWHDLSMIDALHQRFAHKNLPSVPITIVNDANAAALSEFVFGHSQYRRSALVHFTIGIGVGAGIITEKGLYLGFNGWAGEIGHSILQPVNGRLCACGQYGCVETLVSQRALSQLITNNDEQLLSVDLLLRRLAKNDDAIKQGLNTIGHHLGIVLRNVANILNPETIVLGGPMSQFGSYLLNPTIHSFKAHTGRIHNFQPAIKLCEFGPNAAALGAAAAVLNQHVEPLDAPTQLMHQGLLR